MTIQRAGIRLALLVMAGLALSQGAPRASGLVGNSPASKASTGATPASPEVAKKALEAYGRLAMSFEANQGQVDPRAEFIARGKGYTLFLERGGQATLSLRAASPASPRPSPASPAGVDAFANDVGAVLKLRFEGSEGQSIGYGDGRLPGKVNYLVGNDRTKWQSKIPTFSKVRYENVYPGIDVVYYGNQQELEYDFIVHAGADPSDILIHFDGADSLRVNDAGELVASLGGREVVQQTPVIYQEIGGQSIQVAGRYRVVDGQRATFDVEKYDASVALTIDPVLVYSTYIGGNASSSLAHNAAEGIAIDSTGAAYVGGYSNAADFPITAGSFALEPRGGDVFVVKLTPAGDALQYASYFGGARSDSLYDLQVDADGAVYVTGVTESTDFPTTPGAIDVSSNGNYDAFLAKLDATGSSLLYSTYIGGSSDDFAYSLALDGAGAAYVTGSTYSNSFPVTAGAFDSTPGSSSNAFVTKVGPGGAALAYSTFLGGNGGEEAQSIDVDASGNAFVTGSTTSADYPMTAGAFDTSFNGTTDAFVSKLSPAGSSLIYSTYLGANSSEVGYSIKVGAAGNAYIAGYTFSPNFPYTAGSLGGTTLGDWDGFVASLNVSGSALVFARPLGGNSTDFIYDLAVDASGALYVAGTTHSANFPTTAGAYDVTPNGVPDSFVAKIASDGASLAYSTFIGGAGFETASSIALDGLGQVSVVGRTESPSFPTTPGAFDTTRNGNGDAYVIKLNALGTSIVYSTFVGGTFGVGGFQGAEGIAVDAQGAAYVTGTASSANFPTTAGSFDVAHSGYSDAFVLKLTPAGDAVEYSTFLGGASQDFGYDISVDGSGAAHVAGLTESANFPVTPGAFSTTLSGGFDVFIAKLDPTGATLLYATLLGGTQYDVPNEIVVDSSGFAYTAGRTQSANFPATAGAFDISKEGSDDAFIVKLNPTGSALAYSTFLGGTGFDEILGLDVDASGSATVSGKTTSSTFPTTPGAADTTFNGNIDAFVAKLSPGGSSLLFSTFLGGTNQDTSVGVALDSGGRVHVTGYTSSNDFPTTVGAADTTFNGGGDTFVTTFAADGAIVYSTFVGGASSDDGAAIAVDADDNVLVTGSTFSANFPTTEGQPCAANGGSDLYLLKVTPAGVLGYASCLGGTQSDTGRTIAVDSEGAVYVAGQTQSSNFPVTPGAFDETLSGGADVFVTKLLPYGDSDGDGVADNVDNCSAIANADQADADGDGIGDLCDPNPTNDPPVASDGTLSVTEDQPASGTLTATDEDGNPLTYQVVAQPSKGSVTITNATTGAYTYTPNANANGSDGFTFTARDASLTSNVATVSVTIAPVNDPPVANGFSVSTAEDTPLSGTLGGQDVDGDTLTFQLTGAPPTRGAVVITNTTTAAYTFTPSANAYGADAFSYQVSDGTSVSAPATVTVSITPVNDAPAAAADAFTTPEDTPLTVAAPGVLGNDSDVDSPTLTASVVSAPATGTLTLNSDGSFTYTAPADFTGPVTFAYQASDGALSSAATTVTITVTNANDAPVATADAYTTSEDTPLSVPAPGVLGNDTDADGQALTAVVVTPPSGGSLALNPDGSFVYTPAANVNGPVTFSYQASDGNASSSPVTVTINVSTVNDGPVATDDAYTTNEDAPLTVAAPGLLANDTDPENDPLTAAPVAPPATGTLTLNADGSFSYTPAANQTGTVTFTYSVTDGTATSTPATVSISVIGINDTPTAAPDSYTTIEDTPLTVAAPGVLGNDSDLDGQPLTATLVAPPASGALTLNADGGLTYTPAPNFSGPVSFTYSASDGIAASTPATVTITVTAVNDAPVAGNGTLGVAAGASANGTLTATDVDGPALTYQLVANGTKGTAVITNASTGAYTYTAQASTSGTDTFTFRASDGTTPSNLATITVTITSSGGGPVAQNATITTNEDQAANGRLVATPNRDRWTYRIVTNPTKGTVVITNEPNGAYRYVPFPNVYGTDSFTFQASDRGIVSNVATVTITITPVNDRPVAASATYTTPRNTPVTGTLQAVDVEGSSLTYSIVNRSNRGTVTINATTGAFTFTPNAGFSGPTSFTFRASDGALQSNTATVTIMIER